MSHDEIKELLELFNASGVGELELQRGEDRIRIRKAGMAAEVTAAGAAAQTALAEAPTKDAEPVAAVVANGVTVTSPILGTYYDAASPDSPPFVKVGDAVQIGQTLCIIESMKLMNEIAAETTGIVAEKLAENGKPVEYGQALFTIQPR